MRLLYLSPNSRTSYAKNGAVNDAGIDTHLLCSRLVRFGQVLSCFTRREYVAQIVLHIGVIVKEDSEPHQDAPRLKAFINGCSFFGLHRQKGTRAVSVSQSLNFPLSYALFSAKPPTKNNAQ